MKISLEKRNENIEILNSIYKECWENKDFIDDLKNNPIQSIKDNLGISISLQNEKKTIEVSDQTDPNIIFLNIPAKLETDDIELTNEELELVSGGAICGGLCIVGIIFVASVVVGFLAEGDGKEAACE